MPRRATRHRVSGELCRPRRQHRFQRRSQDAGRLLRFARSGLRRLIGTEGEVVSRGEGSGARETGLMEATDALLIVVRACIVMHADAHLKYAKVRDDPWLRKDKYVVDVELCAHVCPSAIADALTAVGFSVDAQDGWGATYIREDEPATYVKVGPSGKDSRAAVLIFRRVPVPEAEVHVASISLLRLRAAVHRHLVR